MGPDALLARMESRAVVATVTRRYREGVTAKTLPIKACTPVTPVTPKTDNAGNDASYVGVGEAVTMARCWRVHFAKRDPMGVIFAEPVAPADVRAAYPDAGELVRQNALGGTATLTEAAELRALVATTQADDAERAEALAVARADPDAALTCYHALEADR